ncbi:hypothetical protein [Candidatus Accumulibacter sp. ACC003]|uniref:hypothetical protein n=1 Tax=Candidatus Accumulibacter sp. ACC003 TaxID=2823334 RepID=UPI0025C20138|nr:hypothetical protein [Candidatus Accumulibacter sp. ACC003]
MLVGEANEKLPQQAIRLLTAAGGRLAATFADTPLAAAGTSRKQSIFACSRPHFDHARRADEFEPAPQGGGLQDVLLARAGSNRVSAA